MDKILILSIILLLGLSKNTFIMAQDWPNMAKYQQANLALKTHDQGKSQQTLQKLNRVVFMGNSITEGWSVAHPDFFKGKHYINRGISGQTTPQMLLRFRQDVIDLNPKVVVILAGTNDIAGNTGPISLDQIRDNILSMIQLAKTNGIKPILCSVLPAYDYSWRPGVQPNIKIPKLNQMLMKMAKSEAIPYVDFFASMADERNGLPKDLAEDGVHPTKKGYEIMEGLIESSIVKTLNQTNEK